MKVKSAPLPLHSWAQRAFLWCVLLLSLVLTHSARAQVNWTLRDPLPTTAAFYSVTYGNGGFVAVGLGHLLGDSGLPAMFERAGYRVVRDAGW